MTESDQVQDCPDLRQSFSSHSKIGRQLSRFDWSTSAFPHPDEWPVSLKTLVRTVLDSGFPMFVLWGPELACLYNDAYTIFLKDKHPDSLGKSFGNIWPELMAANAPIIADALKGKSSHFEDAPCEIFNPETGVREQFWMTFSYTPAYDDRGNICGMFCVAKDTTPRVKNEKRRAFQLQIADAFRNMSRPLEIMQRACSMTGAFLGASRVGYAEVDEVRQHISIVRDWTNGSMPSRAGHAIPFGIYGSAIIEAIREDRNLCIADVRQHPDVTPELHQAIGEKITSAVVIPLIEDGQLISCFYVHEEHARQWTSEDIALIEDVARRTCGAVRRAKITEALHEETRTLQMLNKTGQSLASKLNFDELMQSITDAGTKLSGAQFGAFFYTTKDANGEALALYNLSGAPQEVFEALGHPRQTGILAPTFNGTGPVRSDDITKDPRYGALAPHHGMPPGHLPVKSYMAVSVSSRSGEVLGALLFGHPDAGVFSERTEHLIVSLAAQAAIAIDNANLYEVAQKSAQERQELLSRERAARSEAESMIRSKDEFLAMLAHELRNPLAPVSAAAQILRISATDPKRVVHASEIISRQVGHLTHLIDDLLDVSRVTRGLIQLERKTFDMKSIVATAVEQANPLIEAKKHVLTTRVDGAPVYVNADRTRIIQVISNLLNNAAKYTAAGGEIMLSVSATGGEVIVSITDNGCGMEPDLVEHVFDLFTQGSRSLDRTQGGLGIGLALVKAIVTLHEGRVSVISDGTGKGSTFSIALPQAGSITPQADEASVQGAASRTSKIMIVDDNVDAAQSLGVLLEALEYEVSVKETARGAIEDAPAEMPDIFILDIGLPDMTGLELAKHLRSVPAFAGAKMIALTGYGQPQDREMSREAGFDHHLVKPANMQLLMNILSNAHVSAE